MLKNKFCQKIDIYIPYWFKIFCIIYTSIFWFIMKLNNLLKLILLFYIHVAIFPQKRHLNQQICNSLSYINLCCSLNKLLGRIPHIKNQLGRTGIINKSILSMITIS